MISEITAFFVRDFFWLFDSFIISFATVLALRAEIIGGVSTSTSVPGALPLAGGPSSPTAKVAVVWRIRRAVSLTRLDEYRVDSAASTSKSE